MSSVWTARKPLGFAAFLLIALIAAPPTSLGETISLDSVSPTTVDEADLLNPGLSVQVSRGAIGLTNGDELDALSHGMDALWGLHVVYFSVDRAAQSQAGGLLDSANFNVYSQAGLNQEAGDIFATIDSAGVASYPRGDNMIHQHQSFLGLVPNILWFQNNTGEELDNLDALSFEESDLTNDGVPDVNTYFSLGPNASSGLNSPTLTANGWSGADILVDMPGGGLSVFASAASMGLDAEEDDIDALVVLDMNRNGAPDAGDRAMFSLAPGSKTLTDNAYSPGDLFATTFSQGHVVLYEAENLGLLGTDNLDALEVQLVPEPGTLALLALGGVVVASRRRRRKGRS